MSLPGDFEGNLFNWLNAQGYAIPQKFTVGFGDARGNRGFSNSAGVQFSEAERPNVEALASRYGRRGPIDPRLQSTLSLMIHEALHQSTAQREPGFWDTEGADTREWEEAAVEQSARNLLPAAMKQMFGARFNEQDYAVPTFFQQPVKAFRQLSTFGSGAKSYKDRSARLWQRQFQQGDVATRRQMLDQANAARAAWGQRTGR